MALDSETLLGFYLREIFVQRDWVSVTYLKKHTGSGRVTASCCSAPNCCVYEFFYIHRVRLYVNSSLLLFIFVCFRPVKN